jgi:flavin-dependent dehydrogenase
MVMRERFDLHILSHARVEVQDGTPVTGLQQDESGVTVTIASGETLRGRYLIGADGANSRVSQLIGLRRDTRMGAAIEAEVPVSDGLLDKHANTALFLFGMPSKGYLWIFPKAEHLSVGIGAFQARVSNMKQILRREIGTLGIPIDGARLRGHPLPVHLKREAIRQGRVLLVGDAAGLMDPLLGEGIRHAIDSGQLAAECLLKERPQDYSQRVHRRIGRDLLWARHWARLFYNHPCGSFELAVRNPLFVRDFLRLLAGRISYRRLAARAIPNVLLGWHKTLPLERGSDVEPIAQE